MMLHVALVIFTRSVFQDRVSIAESMILCCIITATVAEWLGEWDTLTVFEATVCGRS